MEMHFYCLLIFRLSFAFPTAANSVPHCTMSTKKEHSKENTISIFLTATGNACIEHTPLPCGWHAINFASVRVHCAVHHIHLLNGWLDNLLHISWFHSFFSFNSHIVTMERNGMYAFHSIQIVCPFDSLLKCEIFDVEHF